MSHTAAPSLPVGQTVPEIGQTALPDAARTINLAAAWELVSPEGQRRLGMIAIAFGLAELALDVGFDVPFADEITLTNYVDAAGESLTPDLSDLVMREVLQGDIRNYRMPALHTLGIRQCAQCGCTDLCACDSGCSWVGPNLCSACQDDAAPESSHEHP